MKLEIQIDMDNDAFESSRGEEAARILRQIAQRLEEPYASEGSFFVRDINGNRVGKVSVE